MAPWAVCQAGCGLYRIPTQGSWERSCSTELFAIASPTLHYQMDACWFCCPQGSQTPWHKSEHMVNMAVLGWWLDLILEVFSSLNKSMTL